MEKVKKRQRLLSLLSDNQGRFYYTGAIDGKDGPMTKDGARRFLEDYGFEVETVVDLGDAPTIDGNAVMVFSLAADGDKLVSPHFRVREFACNDGSDVVLIHPLLPVWAEALRTINGAFEPTSSYRTVSYNASIKDASPKSKHCHGIAMDVPAVKATPEELYDLALTLVGESGGLGIYPWGIHMDARPDKSRWDYRKK